MKSNPLVSVIIPYYDNYSTLPLAVASLVCQTYDCWECIIVDDGSSIPAESVIRPIDNRFRLVRLKRNFGRGAARQAGLDASRGDFIAFLDADDWYMPTKLQDQISFLHRNPDVDIVGTGMVVIVDDEIRVEKRGANEIPFPRTDPYTGRVGLCAATICMAREVGERIGYCKSLRDNEDWDFLIRAQTHYRCANLSSPLYVYNRQGSLSWQRLIEKRLWSIRARTMYLRDSPVRGAVSLLVHVLKLVCTLPLVFPSMQERMLKRSNEPAAQRLKREVINQHREIADIGAQIAVG